MSAGYGGGGGGMEERRRTVGGNRRSLDDVGLCVSLWVKSAIWTFLFLVYVLKSPVPSCEKRKMKKKGGRD